MLKLPGKIALAPMAGVTDRAFREICMEFGADYCITEMVSSKAVEQGNKKTDEYARLSEKEQPAAIQIFGDDPKAMAYCAENLLRFSPWAIDINMGCPAPKIASSGGGANLMRQPELCGRIVRAVSRAVPIPVTVKIRKGWDENSVNAVEIAKICEEAGASAITVHGRTRAQMYSGQADYDIIRRVKEAVSVPVIGNGDVKDTVSAQRLFDETGCDMIMIGRAAQGNPWIFRELSAYFKGEAYLAPGVPERMTVMREHVSRMCEYKGEKLGIREARKHFAWYLHSLRGAAAFRREAVGMNTLSDLDSLIERVLKENVETAT